MKIYTLTHIADWEGGVTVYGSHADLWEAVKAEAERVADDTGKWLPSDPQRWPEFIEEHGWKVQHYVIEEHDAPEVTGEMFDMTPAERVRCATCNRVIRHRDGDEPDDWHDSTGSYRCATRSNDYHAPAEVTR